MRKLLKYEFRALWRVFIPFWAAILALGLLNGFTLRKMLDTPMGATVSLGILVAYMVAVIAVQVVAFVFMINRFYKGLLQDNGYLVFTLPVSTDAILWSKAVAAVLLFSGTTICCVASLLLQIRDLPLDSLWQAGAELGQYLTSGGVAIVIACGAVCLLILVTSVFAVVFQCYLSMSIGHLANKGRGVLSVLAFIGINIAESTLRNMLTLDLISFEPVSTFLSKEMNRYVSMIQGTPEQVASALGMLLLVLLVVLLLVVIEGLIYFLFTRLILNRRLNLQ